MGLKHIQVAVWAAVLLAMAAQGTPVEPGSDDPGYEEVIATGTPITVFRNGRAISIDCTDPRLSWICDRLVSGTFQPWWWDYYAEDYGFLESGAFDERNEGTDLGDCESLATNTFMVGATLMAIPKATKGSRAAYKWLRGDRSVPLHEALSSHKAFTDNFDVMNASSIIWTPPPPPGYSTTRGILFPQTSASRAKGNKVDLALSITGLTGAVVTLGAAGTWAFCSFSPTSDEQGG